MPSAFANLGWGDTSYEFPAKRPFPAEAEVALHSQRSCGEALQ